MRRGRLLAAAVRSRQAATSWATARWRRDMLRMSPSFHQASSGLRAGARWPKHLITLVEGPVEAAERTRAVR